MLFMERKFSGGILTVMGGRGGGGGGTPDWAVLVRAYRKSALCPWERHLTLILPLSTQVYKWVGQTLHSIFFFPFFNVSCLFCFILGSFKGGWSSQAADRYQYLQIDLGEVTKVTRIATQGRYDAGWWTKTYSLDFSEDGGTFKPYNNGQVLCKQRFTEQFSDSQWR